jgi:hypothetical protein
VGALVAAGKPTLDLKAGKGKNNRFSRLHQQQHWKCFHCLERSRQRYYYLHLYTKLNYLQTCECVQWTDNALLSVCFRLFTIPSETLAEFDLRFTPSIFIPCTNYTFLYAR